MTNPLRRWPRYLITTFAAAALAACGGGSGGGTATTTTANSNTVVTQDPGAPVQVGVTATDGLNWINYRRAQIGIPTVSHNALIDKAAQAHSDYQRINDTVTHDESAGKQGFTGVSLLDRLKAAGYTLSGNYAYGEVISATSNTSGSYMAEELITAIYHRFVIFEPRFKEIGTGASVNATGYAYFTADFASSNGLGPGIGSGKIVVWPFSGQTGVTTNFFSDYESPDPVANINEVGYPISVHADIGAKVVVSSFSVRPHGGSDLNVKLLMSGSESNATSSTAAAIIPLTVLKSATTYDVSFAGTVDGISVSKTWSFTTK